MKTHHLTLAACLAATSGLALAQQAAKPEQRMISRDELRACMNAETTITARKKALVERNAKHREEQAAIAADSAELKEEGERLSRNNSNMDRYNRKVRSHNQRIDAAISAGNAINDEAAAVNKDTVAYNQNCTGVAYRPEDREAILKEMAGAPKQ